MNTRWAGNIALSAILIGAGVAPRVRGQQTPAEGVGAILRNLAEEVRNLRLETLALRIEIERGGAAGSERELLALTAERQRLEQEAAAYTQEILSIDRQMAEAELGPDEQQQLLARKTELYAEIAERLRVRQNDLSEREAAARGRLYQQLNRMQVALAQRSELSRSPAQNPN